MVRQSGEAKLKDLRHAFDHAFDQALCHRQLSGRSRGVYRLSLERHGPCGRRVVRPRLGGRPNIVKAQYQRQRVVRRAPVARSNVAVRRNASNRRAVAAGVGAVAAIGVIGAVAAANRRPARQQYYYDQGYYPAAAPVYAQPVCRVRNEELYNRNGVYRGVFQVQDCR